MKTGEKPSLGILLVEDHHAIREAFALWIDHQDGLQTVGQAGDLAGARAMLAKVKPDVLLFDLMIGASDGIAFIREVRETHPGVPILVYSTQDEMLYAEHVLKAGASGYIMKREPSAELLTAIRDVAEGRLYASPRIKLLALNHLIDGGGASDKTGVHKLTPRELHIFQLIGHGLAPREIAPKLGIGQRGVEAHRENIKNKLGCQSATELARTAARWVDEQRQGK